MRRTTPATDDPGMVVRCIGCTGGASSSSAVTVDGGYLYVYGVKSADGGMALPGDATNNALRTVPVGTTVTSAADNIATGFITAIGQDVRLTTAAQSPGVAISIGGSWVGTITFEASPDGTTWGTHETYNPVTTVETTQISTTANGFFQFVNLGGITQVRARASATITGTVQVTINGTQGRTDMVALGMKETGTTVPSYGTMVGGSDGTNIRFMRTATDGTVRTDPTGTTTQPISAASLPLPTGASTATNQTTLGSQTTKINDGTNTAAVKAASTAAAATDPALVASLSPNSPLPTGSNTIGALTANQSINLAQVAGTTTVTGGVAGTQGVGGLAASGATKAGNPLQTGAVFNTTQPTVTTGQAVEAQATARGAHIVAPGVDGFSVTANAGTNLNTSALALDATLSRAQGSTTSGQTGPLVQGAVTDTYPAYTTGTTRPMSISSLGALRVSIMQHEFVFSTVNTSSVQLAPAATFTGGCESVVSQPAYSVLLFSDMAGTLTVSSYQDAACANVIQTQTFTNTASTGISRSGTLNADYFKVTYQNTGGSTTTKFVLETAYGDILPATQLNNLPIAINEVNGANFTLGQAVMASSLPVAIASNQGALTVVAPAATTTSNAGACVSVTASATVLASNGSRRAASVCARVSNSDTAFIKLGTTATTANFPLEPGQCYNLGGGTIYTGTIDAIANTGTQSLCVLEQT